MRTARNSMQMHRTGGARLLGVAHAVRYEVVYMGEFTATKINAISAAVCTASAAETGNKILTIVTACISAATLIANFLLDCYRKYRDRDKDIKDKENKQK